jgi:hypothetical protein
MHNNVDVERVMLVVHKVHLHSLYTTPLYAFLFLFFKKTKKNCLTHTLCTISITLREMLHTTPHYPTLGTGHTLPIHRWFFFFLVLLFNKR